MKKSFFFVVLSITLTSCATIMSGAKQNVKISSSPSQATVIVDSLEIGKTPLKTKLKRKQNHIVRLELEGYQPYEIELKRKFNAWIIGNAMIGGAVGVIVDLATGSFYYLSPKELNVELENGTVFSKDNDSDIYIGVTLNPDPNWQKGGELTRL